MRITKLKFSNIYGIKERELKPGDITIFEGANGKGKTSILDAISTALTNKGLRPRVIKNGAEEAELLVETDNGLTVDRKKRVHKSDYTSVKRNGETISSPQAYLADLFNTNQINPLEFIEMSDRQQAKILLSMTNIDFGLDDYKKAFGCIPPDFDAEKHVLENLDYFQSNKSEWWKQREEANRKELFKRQTIKEEQAKLPEGYDREHWENVSLTELHQAISEAKKANESIEQCERYIEDAEIKKDSIRYAYSQKENRIRESYVEQGENIKRLSGEYRYSIEQYETQIKDIQEKIKQLEHNIETADTKEKELEILLLKDIKANNNLMQQELDTIIEKELKSQEYINTHDKSETEPLEQQAEQAEEMKSYIKLCDSIDQMKTERLDHEQEAADYNELIMKARALPNELLEKANMPIPGITIENGELLIDGLPIGNLSDGEKLELAMDVAKAQTGELKIVLADGLEKLSKEPRERFLKKAKESGIQFFVTRVTDSEEINIIEM